MAMASPARFLSADPNSTYSDDPWLPSLPPPPLNSSSSDSTPVHVHQPDRLLPNLLISAASLLAFSFLLLLISYFLLRLRRRRRRRHREAHQPSPPQNPDDVDDSDLLEEGDGTHHVWYIRTVGLDESTIRSIAATVYKAGDGLIDGGSDCSVCLAEFKDGEIIKLLPKCTHAFHLSCIDTWLRSHVSCPLCRAPIVGPVAVSAAVDPVEPQSNSSSPVESTQIEIPPSDQEETGIEIDTSSGPSSELPADLGENELQPVRRSVSMDSSSLGVLLLRVELEKKKELDFQQGGNSKNTEKQEKVSKGDSLDKGSLEMGRSLSSRSGRFFFSRYGRARRSVLPL